MKSYSIPKPIKPGDTFGICAPSGAFNNDIFSRGINVLKSMGFNVHIPDEIYEKKRYMAGDDQLRASVVNALFKNSDINAIICARGGFGALRTLDYIDYDMISKHPKLFVGFSDITALLVTIVQRSLVQVLHGPVVTTLADASDITLRSLYQQLTSSYKLLTCAYSSYESTITSDLLDSAYNLVPVRTLREGSASGRLTGGNLSTLCHLTGTRFQPNLDGAILFLEDVGEPPYKIDRMLTQMKLAGMFSGVKGVIVGSFERCGDHAISGVDNIPRTYNVIDEIMIEIFDNLEQPIVAGINAGHCNINISLRFGTLVEINTHNKKGCI